MSLNGQVGTWTVADDSTLRFEPEKHEGQATGIAVPSGSIVGVFQTESSPDQYRLLYTKGQESTESPKSPVHVHVAQATGLPSGFISKHSIDLKSSVLLSGSDGHDRSNMEVSVIVSTESGGKQASEFFKQALQPTLEACGLNGNFKVYTTESEHSITELARSTFAVKSGEGINQTVILLSGDGGTIDLVNALSEELQGRQHKPVTLVTLPLGSGNALANSYRYNQDDTLGLSTLVRGKPRSLPMFRASFSTGARVVVDQGRGEQEMPLYDGSPSMVGVVVCSWGLHASLVADSDTAHYRQFGSARFQMVAKQLMFPEDGSPMHEYTGKVSFSEQSGKKNTTLPRSTHSYVLATLVSNLEKTFCVSPDSKSLDGQLRLVELPPMGGEELTQIMMGAYAEGKHIGKEKVGYHTIDGLEIVFEEQDDRWRRVCVDGKIVKVDRGGFVRLKREETALVNLVCLPAKE